MPIRDVFRRFWPHARPYRFWLPVVLLLVAIGAAIEAATIWMYKILVDDVLVSGDFGLLGWVLGAYLALTLLDGAITFFDDCLSGWISGRFIVGLRTDLFRHLHSLSLGFFERRQLGDLISRLSGDVKQIEYLLLSGIASVFAYVFQLVVFIGVLLYLEWRLTLVSLFVVPLFWLSARYFSQRIRLASRERRRRAGAINAVAEESLSNVALVQSYNQQAGEVERFERENEGSFNAQMAATRLSATFSPLVNLIELAGVFVVIVLGAYEVSRGRLTIGGLLVFLVYLGMLYRPIRGLSGQLNSFYSAAAGAERIIEILDQRPAVVEKPGATLVRDRSGLVEFDAVSFRYPGTATPALSDVSFAVHPGQVLALVGHSGAGKSTVAKLLVRFYDPDAGVIRLNGDDLRDLSLSSLRDNVAVLLQETLVFDGTIRENIAYGKPGATSDEIEQAAIAADAHAFIGRLPDGYETVIGQKGRLLSGGQRQRLAIARAMIRDAPVLILDEPTTGLDAESGQKIMEPIQRLLDGRTAIVISHNLLTTRMATEIVVLDAGQVVERGTHDELLLRDGQYARLYRLHGMEALAALK